MTLKGHSVISRVIICSIITLTLVTGLSNSSRSCTSLYDLDHKWLFGVKIKEKEEVQYEVYKISMPIYSMTVISVWWLLCVRIFITAESIAQCFCDSWASCWVIYLCIMSAILHIIRSSTWWYSQDFDMAWGEI